MKRLILFAAMCGLPLGLIPGREPAEFAGEVKTPRPVLVVQEKVLPKGKGYVPLTPARRAVLHKASVERHGRRLEMLAKFKDIPPAFDARDKGWVIPVGDQGQCGSCYLYSTVYGTMTQAFVKAGYGKNDGSLVMAVQFGMDCHNFGGCNGGNGTEVIAWAVQNGWPAEKWTDIDGTVHADYPGYQASSGACRRVPGAKLWKPADWGFVAASPNRPATTLEIKTALITFGALNVALDAGGQFGNGTGTITSLGTIIDHEIELVAYDDKKDGGAFLLKNQWDTSWGVGGYRWVTYAAARNLVDVFFVTVAPLPPPPAPPTPPVPPVPPVPPGPPSPGATNISITGPLVVGGTVTGELLPTGTDAAIKALALLTQMNPPGPTPTPEPPMTVEARLAAIEAGRVEDRKVIKTLLDEVLKLQKILGD